MRTCYCFAYLFNVLKSFIYLFIPCFNNSYELSYNKMPFKSTVSTFYLKSVYQQENQKLISSYVEAWCKIPAVILYWYIDWRFVIRNIFTVVSAFCCLYFISTYQTFIDLISNFIFTKTFFTVKLCLSKKPSLCTSGTFKVSIYIYNVT